MTATQIDLGQLKRGMVYKVFNTKRQSKMERAPAFGYCKTKYDLERMRRIKHRGLAKAMWGKSLNQIGLQIPLHIQRLMSHANSPALEELNYSSTKLTEDPAADTVTVEVENKAENIERYAEVARNRAYEIAWIELQHRLSAIANKEA